MGGGTDGGAGGGMGGVAGVGGTIIPPGCERGFEPLDAANPRCGGELCPELPDLDPRVTYEHCCTADERCGSGWEEIFGGECFERDQPGASSDECPTETIFVYYDFVSGSTLVDAFPGCCLPDGRCGLDTSATVAAGCVERSRLSDAVRTACTSDNYDLRFDPIACTP